MVYSMLNKIYRVLIAFICTVVVLSCEQDTFIGLEVEHFGNTSPGQESGRDYNQEERDVLLIYSAGFNSLSSYLELDIKDLEKGWLPGFGRTENVLLVYSHKTLKRGAYSAATVPTLTRLYADVDGSVIRDTLVFYPDDTHSATPEQLQKVLEFVQAEFPAQSYGMIFSSHATGYLPSGYYNNPGDYVFRYDDGLMYRGGYRSFLSHPVPYCEPQHDPSLPQVKSIGQDQVGTYGAYLSYEIELGDFVSALPMEMEYILFDACLMGGVEVAYELKDNCRYVGFSQTEVLAEGFDYTALTTHLLGSETPNPRAVCEDFYHQYDIQNDVYRSATISLVDCRCMEPLAQVCAVLFDKYREAIEELEPKYVQRYYRGSYHWFYDLVDVIAQAGATDTELAELNQAVDDCVLYKAHTPEFMKEFIIRSYSGFSMYLPCNGSAELDKYYRTLKWNIDTGLVE